MKSNKRKLLILLIISIALFYGCKNSNTEYTISDSKHAQTKTHSTQKNKPDGLSKENELKEILFSKIKEEPDFYKHISSLHVAIDSKNSNKINISYLLDYNSCLYMFGQETDYLIHTAYELFKEDYEISFIMTLMTSETDDTLSKSFLTFNGLTGSYRNTSSDNSTNSSSNMYLSSLVDKDAMKIHASSYYTSKKAAKYAKSAVEIAEKYLKGNIAYSKVAKKLDLLDTKMNYVFDMEESDENYSGDYLVSQYISDLSIHIEVYEKTKYSDINIKKDIKELKECY